MTRDRPKHPWVSKRIEETRREAMELRILEEEMLSKLESIGVKIQHNYVNLRDLEKNRDYKSRD